MENPHLIRRVTDPVAAPPEEGIHWVNTLTGKEFFSVGTSSVDDWVLRESGGGGAWGGITGTLSDQTDLQSALDAKVEGNSPITGATKTKITYDSKGLVTNGTDATSADIDPSTDRNYVTDAQLVVIENTSGNNTGDQDLSGYELLTNKATDLSVLNNTLYPTTQAVNDAILQAISTQYTFFLSSVNSDISGYESMPIESLYTPGVSTTITTEISTSPTIIGTFATASGYPGLTTLPIGTYFSHFETDKVSGSANYHCYFELYKRNLAGTETLLATSESTPLDNSNLVIENNISALITTPVTLLASDRLVIKYYAVSASGTPNLGFVYDDNTLARFEMPSLSLGYVPEDVANKDTDVTLAANSDTKYASQKAIKTYVDTKVIPPGSNTQMIFNDSGILSGDSNCTWDKTNKRITNTANALASTTQTSHLLENSTAAVTGSRIQVSPSTEWKGRGWKTNSVAGSQTVGFRAYVTPVTGTTNPLAQWDLQYSVNGATYASALTVTSSVQDGIATPSVNLKGFTKITAANSSTVGTLQNLDIVNSGSRTHIGFRFGSTLKGAFSVHDDGATYLRSAGSAQTINFEVGSGIESTLFIAQFYSQGLYCSNKGLFGGNVTAGSADISANSSLSTYGSFAVKGKLVTDSTYTLASTETFIYVDPSNANVCAGTPAAVCSGSNEATCNANTAVGCNWYSGATCSGATNTDSSTCTGQGAGCVWDEVTCSGANNTDQSTCENQDDIYGGGCSWDSSTCSSQTDQGSCQAISGCTWNFSDCAVFNGNSQGTCEGNSGCAWTGADCTSFNGTDQSTCESGHTGCAWDDIFGICSGVYDEASSCSGQYDTSCSGNLCGGTYNNGNCSGTFGANCNGVAQCNNLTDDGLSACNAQSGCTWTVGVTVTLPSTASANRNGTGRVYSIIHVGETGTVNIVGQSGEPIFQYTTLPLLKKGDKVLLHNQNILFQCYIFATSTPCSAQAGCFWRNCPSYGDELSCNSAGCAWDGIDNICTGGISCVGTYSNGAHWYAHSLERGLNYVEKTANYTLASIDDVINCTANSFNVTLPSAPLNNGKRYEIKNTGAGTITMNTTSGQTIDGNGSGVLTIAAGSSMSVVSNNLNWIRI